MLKPAVTLRIELLHVRPLVWRRMVAPAGKLVNSIETARVIEERIEMAKKFREAAAFPLQARRHMVRGF